MVEGALSSAWTNDRLWQRNGHHAFHRSPYSPHIDPPAYFHTVMDGIIPPSPLLVQIITNQYALKAPHQNIILTHDLFLPLVRSPSHVQGSMVGCSVTNSHAMCEINQSNQLKTHYSSWWMKQAALFVLFQCQLYSCHLSQAGPSDSRNEQQGSCVCSPVQNDRWKHFLYFDIVSAKKVKFIRVCVGGVVAKIHCNVLQLIVVQTIV